MVRFAHSWLSSLPQAVKGAGKRMLEGATPKTKNEEALSVVGRLNQVAETGDVRAVDHALAAYESLGPPFKSAEVWQALRKGLQAYDPAEGLTLVESDTASAGYGPAGWACATEGEHFHAAHCERAGVRSFPGVGLEQDFISGGVVCINDAGGVSLDIVGRVGRCHRKAWEITGAPYLHWLSRKERTSWTYTSCVMRMPNLSSRGRMTRTGSLLPRGWSRRGGRRVGCFRLGVEVEAVICSPRVRAQQTAAPVGEALGRAVQLEERLDGGGLDAAALRGLLADARISESAMLVGHEPDFSEIIEALTGGQVEMKKAAVALVRLDGFRARGGVLIWLAPARLQR